MRRNGTTMLGWLSLAAAFAAGAAVASFPRLRSMLASGGEPLGDMLGSTIRNLQARMRPRFGRQMAVLDQVGPTLDAATTQWDSSMTVSKVSSALVEEPRLRGLNIGVRMIGGILHLEGEVASLEQRSLAGEVARRASGAELVANDLRVASAA